MRRRFLTSIASLVLGLTLVTGLGLAAAPRAAAADPGFGDYTGDQRADLNAVFGMNYFTFRTQLPGMWPVPHHMSTIVGPSWTWLGKVPDLDGNGASDLLVRTSDGTMRYQRMLSDGTRGTTTPVGTGWNGISLMAVVHKASPNNAHPWLLARAANGDLIRYQVGPSGIYSAAKIGKNWNSIAKLFSVGDFSGDGIPDLMAIGTTGLLYRYNMTVAGNISSVNVVGHGWNTFVHAFSPGDMDGDGRFDMMGIRADGELFFYRNTGPGHWAAARYVESDWADADLIT